MLCRQALITDIPKMRRVRMAVRENRLTRTVISEDDYIREITVTGRGWVVELDGVLRGLAVANRADQSIWALFVEPGYEGRGIGRALHDEMLRWLRSTGCEKVSLVTEAGTRAEHFYRSAGWRFVGNNEDGDAAFEMTLT